MKLTHTSSSVLLGFLSMLLAAISGAVFALLDIHIMFCFIPCFLIVIGYVYFRIKIDKYFESNEPKG